MKIERIETIEASKYLFVKITTDTGIQGIGEAGCWGFLDATKATIKQLTPYLMGKDPFRTEHYWQYFYRSMYFRGTIITSAISAIDIALWDIKGKALGVPVYELLGGKYRDKVRTYAPVFENDAKKMAEKCLEIRNKGFSAARLILSDVLKQNLTRDDMCFSNKVEKNIRKVQLCREAVGKNFDLCLEIHRGMSPSEALAFAEGVKQFKPLFLEDPIAPDNHDVMADLQQKISIPIATGERFISIQEFEMIMQRNGAQYVRPDVCVVGGFTAAKKIASIAEANYVSIVPHNPLGPVSTAACLQLDASVPNFLIQEFPSFYMEGNESAMMRKPFIVEDGYIVVPQEPGIGIELIDDITERFPPAQRGIKAKIGYDSAVVDV